MKKLLSFLLAIAIFGCSHTSKTEAPKGPLTFADHMPQYPGGEEALLKFMQENAKYPAAAKDQKIEGTVMMQFVISSDGSVTNVEVLKSVNPLLDAEAMRVILSMPKWTPGMNKGQVVEVKKVLPVKFVLS